MRSLAGFAPGPAIDRWLSGQPFYIRADIVEILDQAPELPPGDVAHRRVVGAAGEEGFEQVMVPRAVALVERLESAAKAYHLASGFRSSPTPGQLEEFFHRADAAATALLEALGTPMGDPREMPDAIGLYGRPEADDLRAVVRIRQWARGGAAWAERRPAVPSHEGDPALDEFLECLARLWRDVFDRKPGSGSVHKDKDGNRRGGPFAKFVLAALKPLRACVPTEAEISDRIRKLSDYGKLGS
jgi:hypothetical protein